MTRWLHPRDKQRQQLLMDNIHFRQNLRMVTQQERQMDALYDQYAGQAIAAEKAGNHRMAVHLAGEAAKLKNFRNVSGSMKTSLEAAHAVNTATRAMNGIITGAKEAVSAMNCSQVAADTIALQTNMALMQDQVQAFMEQNELCLNDFNFSDAPVNEEGEKALADLMSSTRKDQQRKLIQETAKSLDKLPRHRTTDKNKE